MIYLNNAASSFPKPPCVLDTMVHCLKSCASGPGRSSNTLEKTENYVSRTRRLLSRLFNIDNQNRIVFTLNDTYGLNFALKGSLRPGDHVIITCLEHNSILRPLTELEKFEIETTIINTDSSGFFSIEDIKKAINKKTRLIALTHASNVIGTLTPVKEIGALCNEHGIMFLVDAAQTAGVMPIDVKAMNISLLSFPGHKSLFGPMGTGALYVREDVDIIDLIQGGTGTISESPKQPENFPERFESGTPNVPGIAALGAGVDFILRTGMDSIREHEISLTEKFIHEIKAMKNVKLYGTGDMSQRVSTAAINIGDMPSVEVSSILDNKYKIATRGGLHCAPYTHRMLDTIKQGAVRFSIGYFNTEKDIEKALKAVYEIAKTSGP